MSVKDPAFVETREPALVMGVDIGGTSFRSALVDPDGRILPGSVREVPVNGGGAASGILEALAECIRITPERAGLGAAPAAVGVSVPGPFDYDAGISLMDHKLPAIRGVALADRIRALCGGGDGLPVRFFHDIHAFLYGEYLHGAARGCRDVFAVSIGSGLGTGLLRQGAIVANRVGGPAYSLFRTPYRGRIIEETVSRRGILRRYAELSGREAEGDVKGLAERGRAGDKAAIATFREMGEALAAVLAPCVDSLHVGRIVLGGRISGAFDLFAPVLREGLSGLLDGAALMAGADLDGAALRGAAALAGAPEAVRREHG